MKEILKIVIPYLFVGCRVWSTLLNVLVKNLRCMISIVFFFSFCRFTKFTCFRSSCRASSLKLNHVDYKMPLPGLS